MSLLRNSINQSLVNLREESQCERNRWNLRRWFNRHASILIYGIKYLLTVIDVFSKFVWIVPLKRKTRQEVANAFSRILKEGRPSKMWVEAASFITKTCENKLSSILHENEENSCVIERFNRTIKEKMFKYFSANNTGKYVDVLELLVDQYNNTIHSSIQMTPMEASRKENENKV